MGVRTVRPGNGGLSTAAGSPTCSAPLAEGKGWIDEGGIREPLLVRWPQRIAAGGVLDEPVTTPDFYPTLLEAAGLPARPEQHVDGVSFWRLLQGHPFERGPIFWHYPHYSNQGDTPAAAVRDGDWKLIQHFEDGSLRLYDLATDIGEEHDLAGDAAHAPIRDDLASRLARWQESVGALFPDPNPYEPFTDLPG